MAEMPPFDQLIRMEIVHRVPGMAEVAVRRDVTYSTAGEEPLTMDVYEPAGTAPGSRNPAVLMIHGPVPKLGAKNMGVFTSYGRLLAASGLVAVTFNHRFLGPERLLDAAADVQTAADYVRDHANELGIDSDRVAFWAFSAGGPLLSVALRGSPRMFARSSHSTRRSTCERSLPARRRRSRTRRAATSRRPTTSGRRRGARRRSSSPAPGSIIPG